MELVDGRPRWALRFLIAAAALACWPAASAIGEELPPKTGGASSRPAGSAFGYTSRIWQNDEGLPNNYVRAIAQTPDGYLWVGTCDGLARFDGLHFTTFGPRNTPELQRANVSALCAGRDGELWIGTYGGGLVCLREGAFTRFGATNGLAASELSALCLSRDGSLWIGSTEGLSRYQHNRFASYMRKDGLLSDVVRAVCEDSSGSIWIATAEGLNRLQGGVLRAYTRTNGLPDNSIRDVRVDRRGRLWIGSDSGVTWYEQGKFTVAKRGEGLTGGFVQAFCEDSRGEFWVGAYSGIYRYREGGFLPHPDAEGVPFDMINALFEDGEGDVWAGSREGLIRLTPRRFSTYTRRQGLTDDNVMSVLEDRSGHVWIGTWGGGLNRLDGASVQSYTTRNGLSHDLILCLCEGRDGSIWAGADYDGGVTRLKDGQFTHYTYRDGLINAAVRVLHEDRAGDLWVGTTKGLSCLRAGKVIPGPPQEQSANRIVRAICEDHAGRLWFGTEQGLSCWHNGQFTNFTVKDGLSSNVILDLYEDAEHDLWITTFNGGLNRWHRGEFSAYTTRQGLYSDCVLAVVEDNYGCFWMSCPDCIFRVRKAALTGADARAGPIHSVAYGRLDGLMSVQLNAVAQPAAWKSRDGRLWFPTTKGLVVVEPGIPANEAPPPVVIQEVMVDKHPFRPAAASHAGGAPKVAEPAIQVLRDQGELEFQFTALSFKLPEKDRFRYRLEGVDTGWNDAGPHRTADYHGVAPGRYRFLVTACNDEGVWNVAPAALTVVLLPHLWETPWFRALAGLVLAGGLAGAVRYVSVRKLRTKLAALEREHGIERERARIAKDIHDDLGSRLTQITLLSHLAQDGPPLERQASVRKVSATAEAMAQALDEIVWAVNPEHDTLQGLVEYLSQSADDFLEDTSIHCHVTLPSQMPQRAISAEVRHQLFLAFKEALNNVVKHASASEIRIALTAEAGRFQILIADNGVGFDLGSPGVGGNGLKNMRKRLEAIGGQFQVASQPGQGTHITMSIPL